MGMNCKALRKNNFLCCIGCCCSRMGSDGIVELAAAVTVCRG